MDNIVAFIFKWVEANLNHAVVRLYFRYESYKTVCFLRNFFMVHFNCEGRRERFNLFPYIKRKNSSGIISKTLKSSERVRCWKSNYCCFNSFLTARCYGGRIYTYEYFQCYEVQGVSNDTIKHSRKINVS